MGRFDSWDPFVFPNMDAANQTSNRELLEDEIRRAFAGVVLGNGISLSQTAISDNYGREVTERGYGVGRELSNQEYADLRRGDPTEDWASISYRSLDTIAFPYLDAEALRYYLPALMVAALARGDSSDWAWIALMSLLENPGDRLQIFSERQLKAVALFVRCLPDLVDLEEGEKRLLHRAASHWDSSL